MNYSFRLTFFTGLASVLLMACSMADDASSQDVKQAEPIVLTLKQSEKADADNRFGFRMFREVSALSQSPNAFFSPLSLNMALGMLFNGAAGATQTEMAETLGMAGFTDTEINKYYQKMSQALLSIDPLTEISIANSIWHRSGFSVKQPFIEVNKKYFDAEVQSLDFNKSDAADIINKWCADKTKNRIKEIVKNPIGDDVMTYLFNALYFKSKWLFEFEKKNTKKDDFTTAGNRKIQANMMEQTATLPYYADQHLLCVEMPYGNQAFSMVAVLPSDNMDIDHLIEYLDNNAWQNIVKNLREQKVWLKLPRFKIECDIPLVEPVKNVGMRLIFDPDRAEFPHISTTPLFVSDAKQKTFVEVNEEGTEAAAVTVVVMTPTSIGPNTPVAFFANRPFLYLIKEKSTGVILFIGRMDEPVE